MARRRLQGIPARRRRGSGRRVPLACAPLLAQVEGHDGGPGAGLKPAAHRRRAPEAHQKHAWNACLGAVTIAEMHLKDTQLILKNAQLAAMFQVAKMGLAREEALLEQLDVQLERKK